MFSLRKISLFALAKTKNIVKTLFASTKYKKEVLSQLKLRHNINQNSVCCAQGIVGVCFVPINQQSNAKKLICTSSKSSQREETSLVSASLRQFSFRCKVHSAVHPGG